MSSTTCSESEKNAQTVTDAVEMTEASRLMEDLATMLYKSTRRHDNAPLNATRWTIVEQGDSDIGYYLAVTITDGEFFTNRQLNVIRAYRKVVKLFPHQMRIEVIL